MISINEALISDRLEAAFQNKGLSIGEVWNLLGEAAAEIAKLKDERDEAFRMSRCECEANECCANLVKHAAIVRAVENAPRGTVDSILYGGYKRPAWVVVDDRNIVPSIEARRVALVPIEEVK